MRRIAKSLTTTDLYDTKSFVLSHGLNFGLPPRYLRKEEIFAEFESLWVQLLHHSASSVEQHTTLKARVANLAHLYCDSIIDSRDFTMHKECFRAINRLRKNDYIIVIKPDKGSGVVLLNKSDYVDKMNEILDDQSKFKDLFRSPAVTTQPTLNRAFRSGCLT